MLDILMNQYSEDDVFLVAVSGGPDSMALLHMLTKYPLKFVVCNVNYKTRKESDLEAKMVEDYALKHNMVFEGCNAKENNISNFQDSARVFRYNFFHDIYQKYNAKGLIVAHHLDDALETFLMSLTYEGRLHTFAPKAYLSRADLTVIRPMLYVLEKDIITISNKLQLPIVKNNCPADGYTSRQDMKDLLTQMEQNNPLVKERMQSALTASIWNQYCIEPTSATIIEKDV